MYKENEMQHFDIKKIHHITNPVFFEWRNSQLADKEYLNWDVQGVNHCMGSFHVIVLDPIVQVV